MNKSIIKILFICSGLLTILSTGTCYCQEVGSGSWPTVGIESDMEASLPLGDLMAVGVKERTDLILRIVSVTPEEGGFSYDLRYIGLLPGNYNLSDYLLRPDGSLVEDLPPVFIQVLPLLPQGHQGELVSNQLKACTPPGGYKLFFTIIWILWLILLGPLIFAFRERQLVTEEAVIRPATLDELLRPLVEKALAGGLDASGKGHLERLLMGYWQEKLNLDQAKVYRMLMQIKQHPQGGQLFEKLESWLHRPPGAESVDIDELLAPYKNISVIPDEKEIAE
jgi:hypothetical protein